MTKRIFLVFDGIVSIALSILCFCLPKGHNINLMFFGGDAFTEIQQAAAKTGWNVQALTEIVSVGFSSVLLVAGIALITIALPSKKED